MQPQQQSTDISDFHQTGNNGFQEGHAKSGSQYVLSVTPLELALIQLPAIPYVEPPADKEQTDMAGTDRHGGS